MSKLLKVLHERVNEDDVIKYVEGVGGLIAISNSTVYIVRGTALERKAVKSYSIENISSIDIRRPGLMTNGHFQVITSGNTDRTKRFATAFDYAKDDNTVMIRSDYEKFLDMEKLIYELKEKRKITEEPVSENDVFDKLEKLGKLRESGVITEEEFNEKKTELMKQV